MAETGHQHNIYAPVQGEEEREEWGTVSFLFKGCDLCVVHITSTYLPFILWFHLAARQAGK